MPELLSHRAIFRSESSAGQRVVVAYPVQKGIKVLVGTMVLAIVVVVLATVFINARITAWVENPAFVAMLDQETSKGLKLQAHYSPLRRVGLFGISTDSASGTDGYKTIVTLNAQQVSGNFNPLGALLRRWQIDDLHFKSGSVTLQKTDPTPGAPTGTPWPPWWALFWPYRVYLTDVKVDDAKILWKLKDKESGIYDTHLEITPNGRDFEYDARDGDFKTPVTPSLTVLHAHLLIRKPRLYCSEFVLSDDPAHPEQRLKMEGDAGLQADRSVHLKIDLASVNVAPWLPESLRSHVEGRADGHFEYSSTGSGLESGSGQGAISVSDGVLRGLAPVRQYVTVTGSPNPGDLALKVCRTGLRWEQGAISAENIEVECAGVFRLTGTITMAADKALGGQVELGLTDPYLKWLPTAKTAVFTREEGVYHFATVHFSGTTEKPVQDLSPRIAHEVAKSPLLALKLFFNQAGNWLNPN